MKPREDLTVCVTSFGRVAHLERALVSCRKAGIRRLAIAAVAPTPGVLAVVNDQRSGWLSYDVAVVRDDVGCNATWMLAAYLARTDRILVLHDDDVLLPEFGNHYARIIAPALDRGAGFATWEAVHYHEDGSTNPCRFWKHLPGVFPSEELLAIVGRLGRLSLSPVVSVLDRDTVIAACKEAEQTLTENACLWRPGMLLGTEVLVYLRHIGRFASWLYLETLLSGYGYHDGSGTCAAQAAGEEKLLANGYDVARVQSQRKPPPLRPRVILAWSEMTPKDEDEEKRFADAWASWQHLFGTGLVVPCAIGEDRAPASSVGVPFVKVILAHAAAAAQPEDVVLYVNRDNGLTTQAYDRILEGVVRGQGACACPRRNIKPVPGRLYRSVTNCRTTGGFDAFAFTPAWWAEHAAEIPDLLLGREAWDTVLRTLMHEVAIGRKVATVEEVTEFYGSPACCDDVCWHTEHFSRWQVDRGRNAGNIHNVATAQRFFAARGIRFASPTIEPPLALAGQPRP